MVSRKVLRVTELQGTRRTMGVGGGIGPKSEEPRDARSGGVQLEELSCVAGDN